MEKSGIAILSSKNEYTTFSFNGTTLTFLTSKNLERYTKIKTWDDGYIEKSRGLTSSASAIRISVIAEGSFLPVSRFVKKPCDIFAQSLL